MCEGHATPVGAAYVQPGLLEGFTIFFTIVLRMAREDPATPMTVTGDPPTCCNYIGSTTPRVVKMSNIKTTSVARPRVAIVATGVAMRTNAT